MDVNVWLEGFECGGRKYISASVITRDGAVIIQSVSFFPLLADGTRYSKNRTYLPGVVSNLPPEVRSHIIGLAIIKMTRTIAEMNVTIAALRRAQ